MWKSAQSGQADEEWKRKEQERKDRGRGRATAGGKEWCELPAQRRRDLRARLLKAAGKHQVYCIP